MLKRSARAVVLLGAIWGAAASPSSAQTTPGTAGNVVDAQRVQADEIAELKRQLSVVVGELQSLKQQGAAPETEEELRSVNGLGPAASKVYGVAAGDVSLGGYLEANYSRQLGDAEGNGKDTANVLRGIIYVGKKFSDNILFNAEFEVENTEEIELELAQLDFLIRPEFNISTGLLLAPLGFINEVHEPPYFFGNIRPEPERLIIPSTFREIGAGIFGTLGESFSYRAYVLNSLDASGFTRIGTPGAKQNGGNAMANSLAFTGRFDFEPVAGLQLGASIFTGNTGQDRPDVDMGFQRIKFPDAQTRLWEAHTQYENGGFHFRALYTQADIGDADVLSVLNNDIVSSRLVGGYAEVAYDILPWFKPGSESSFSPFFRYEYTDTQNDVPNAFRPDKLQVRRILVPGIQWKPLSNVVIKLDYRNIDALEGNVPDELRLGIGLAF
jgi:hypothetical protein